MSLSLEQVFAKGANEDIGYVFDAPIHYVLLNRPDNTWTLESIKKYLTVLDQIEASEGPGIMVTIGTGARHFSTGFDLSYWIKDYKNMKDSLLFFTN